MRWSWIHWWEANRERFLAPTAQEAPDQGPDPDALERWRAAATRALIDGLDSQADTVRAECALALGRMRARSAVERLAELLVDRHSGIRVVSVIALALIDSDVARAKVAEALAGMDVGLDREAAHVALGLLDRRPARARDVLHHTIGAEATRPRLATTAAWALTRAGDIDGRELLSRARSVWVACTTVEGLGRGGGNAFDIAFLARVLHGQAAGEVAAWKQLVEQIEVRDKLEKEVEAYNRTKALHFKIQKQQHRRRTDGRAGAAGARSPAPRALLPVHPHVIFARQVEQWSALDPNLEPEDRAIDPRRVVNVRGREEIHLARLRGCAAVALGRFDDAAARQALLAALTGEATRYSDLYLGFVIMSAAQIADHKQPQCLVPLVELLKPPAVRNRRERQQRSAAPLRGYAALALGLYARPVRTPQGPVDRPFAGKVAEALGGRLADPGEPLELRCAAAMALGLTARTENLAILNGVWERLRRQKRMSELLAGYLLLARGMLVDVKIIEPAREMLLASKDRTTPDGIIARRAAVLGLGLLRDDAVIPILVEAWHLNHYVNREIAFAFRLTEAFNATERLVVLLDEEDKPRSPRAFAAHCLGILYEPEMPTRLGNVLADTNYMVKNAALRPYQTIANRFLLDYLIATFGDQWR